MPGFIARFEPISGASRVTSDIFQYELNIIRNKLK